MSISHYKDLFALLTGSRLVTGNSEIIAGKTEETLAFYQSSLSSYGFFLVTLGFLWPSFAVFSIITSPSWLLAIQLPNVFLYYELVTRRFSTRENNNATQKNKLLDPLELSSVKKGAVDGSTKKRLAQQAWLYAFLGIISFESFYNNVFINFNRDFAKIFFANGLENSFTEQITPTKHETLPGPSVPEAMHLPTITTIYKMLFKIGLSNKRYGEKIARIAFLIWPSLRIILQLFFRILLFVVDRCCLCLDFFHFYRISTTVMKNIPWISILFIGLNLTYNLVVLGTVTMPLCLALCAFVLIILQHLAFLDHFASRQMYHIQKIARFVEPLFIGNILSKFFTLFSCLSSIASQLRTYILKFDTYLFSLDIEKSFFCRCCLRFVSRLAYAVMKIISFIPIYSFVKVGMQEIEEDFRRQYKNRVSMKQDVAIRRNGDVAKKPFRLQPPENRVPEREFPELYGNFVDNFINFPVVMANAAPFSTELPTAVSSYYSPILSFSPHEDKKIRRPATATGLVIPDHLKLSYPAPVHTPLTTAIPLQGTIEWDKFLDSQVFVDRVRELFAAHVERDQPELAVLLRDPSKKLSLYFNLDQRLDNLKSKSTKAYNEAADNLYAIRLKMQFAYRKYDLRDILANDPKNFDINQREADRRRVRDLFIESFKDLLDNYAKCDQALTSSLTRVVQWWRMLGEPNALLKSFFSLRQIRDDMSAQQLSSFLTSNRALVMVDQVTRFMDIDVLVSLMSRNTINKVFSLAQSHMPPETDLRQILSLRPDEEELDELCVPDDLAVMEFMPAPRSLFLLTFRRFAWQVCLGSILNDLNNNLPNLDETNRHPDRAARLLLGIADDAESDVTQVETDALGNGLATLAWLNIASIKNESPLGAWLVDSIVPKSSEDLKRGSVIPSSMFDDSFLQLGAGAACPLYHKFTDYLFSEGYTLVKSENLDEKNAAMIALLEKQMDFKTSPLRVLAIHQFLKEQQAFKISDAVKTFFGTYTRATTNESAVVTCNKIFVHLKTINRVIASDYCFPNDDVLFIKEQYAFLAGSSVVFDSRWDALAKDGEVKLVLRKASFILFLDRLSSGNFVSQDSLIGLFKGVVESCLSAEQESIRQNMILLKKALDEVNKGENILNLFADTVSNVNKIISQNLSKKKMRLPITWGSIAHIVHAIDTGSKSLLLQDVLGDQVELNQEVFNTIYTYTGVFAHDILRSPKIKSEVYIHHLFKEVLQDLDKGDDHNFYKLRAFLSPSSNDDVISIVNHYFMPLEPGKMPRDQVDYILDYLAKGRRPCDDGCKDHHFSDELINKWVNMQIDRASKAIILPPALVLMLKEGIIYRAANYHDSNPANIYQDVAEEERHASDRLFPPENSPKISAPKQSNAHILTLLARGFWKLLCFALGSTPSLFKKLLQTCYLLPIYVLNLVGSLLLTPWLMAKKFYHVYFTNPLRDDTWDSQLLKKYACLDNRLARLLLVPILSVITLFAIVLRSLYASMSYVGCVNVQCCYLLFDLLSAIPSLPGYGMKLIESTTCLHVNYLERKNISVFWNGLSECCRLIKEVVFSLCQDILGATVVPLYRVISMPIRRSYAKLSVSLRNMELATSDYFAKKLRITASLSAKKGRRDDFKLWSRSPQRRSNWNRSFRSS